VAGDRHVVSCLAELLTSDGSVDIGFLSALAGLPEDGEQDDDPASRFPKADPPCSAIERDPQFVNVIGILQLLDVVVIRHAAG
jgi:hypothetical protein